MLFTATRFSQPLKGRQISKLAAPLKRRPDTKPRSLTRRSDVKIKSCRSLLVLRVLTRLPRRQSRRGYLCRMGAASRRLCYHEPLHRRKPMARGNVPRQPSRSGRQEGARRARGAPSLKGVPAKATRSMGTRSENAAARPTAGRASFNTGKARKAATLKKKVASAAGYAASRVATDDPLAPARVRRIIA